MKKYIYLIIMCFGFSISNSQISLRNCNDNTPIKNAIINNLETGEWLGNTDKDGIILISSEISAIKIIHPDFGELIKKVTENEICLDNTSELLDELIIDTNAKKELLLIIEKSYETYKNHNKENKYYNINHSLSSQTDGLLETFKGDVSLGSILSTTLNNYIINWSPAIIGNKSYKKISSFEYFSYLTEYNFFYNKYSYRNFKEYVTNNDVNKIGNQYYVYKNNDDNFFVLEVDLEQMLIKKYTNTDVSVSFYRKSINKTFDVNDKTLESNLNIEFNLSTYSLKEMIVNEVYLVDNEKFHITSIINNLNLNKEKFKNWKGKGLVGFAKDYIKQQQTFYEDHR